MTEPVGGDRRPIPDNDVPEGALVNLVHEQLAREHRRSLRLDAEVANRRHAVAAARRLDRRAQLADRRARAARAALVALPLQ